MDSKERRLEHRREIIYQEGFCNRQEVRARWKGNNNQMEDWMLSTENSANWKLKA